jgi:precorrin-6Y C5,15-methyltransferase (decarboxylating)
MSPQDLTPQALKIIEEAQVLVGGKRLLNYFPDHPGDKIPLGKDPEGTLSQIPALAATRRVVVLASGDPNFYGVGPLVVKLLGPDRVVVHPNLTAVQAAAARLHLAWHDAMVISLHGRTWEPLETALSQASKLFIYTDPEHTPGAIARWLLGQGCPQARLCVLEDLGQPGELLTWLSPEEARDREFSPLNLVVALLEPAATREPLHLGLPEAALTHAGGLITKCEVRAVVLAKLALLPGLVLWDVGAGCGSVGLEASLLLKGGRIFAVEQDQGRAAQIEANRQMFGVWNLEVVLARAPECLESLPAPQRVFVGGGGKDLAEILTTAINRLGPDGKVVLTATLLDTLEEARRVLNEAGWAMEVVQLQISRSRPLGASHYLQALNPVWIITGSPGGAKP